MSKTGARGRDGPLSRAAVLTAIACLLSAGPASGAGAQGLSPHASPSTTSTPGPWASSQPETPAGGVVEVQAFDLGFSPTTIEIPAAGTSRVVLNNTGFVPHNLTVDALAIQVVAARGMTSEGAITDPAPGRYEFYCSISGHKQAGMVGTLVIQESAPVPPTGAPSPEMEVAKPTA